jgi:hypothetical protein
MNTELEGIRKIWVVACFKNTVTDLTWTDLGKPRISVRADHLQTNGFKRFSNLSLKIYILAVNTLYK